MKTKIYFPMIALVLTGIILAACSGLPTPGAENEATEVPIVKADTRVVVEGRLAPKQDVSLAFAASGEVAEVLVAEGDQVGAGDVLARLGNAEALEAGIANAELELLNAQQALDKLAEAAEEAQAPALRRIAEATRAVRDAQYQLDNYTVPADQEDLDPFEAASMMKEKLDEARAAFEPYKSRSSSDSTREQFKEALDEAQSDYNSAVRRLEYVIALSAAEADLEQALADYETIKDGPKADDVEAAQARITAAEANLASAKAQLDNLELRATISGVVITLDLIVGEQVTPGQPVVTIADTSVWVVETDTLTEIEVVEISTGQQVEIVADALPEQTLTGVVDSISDLFEEKRGDVTYTARILVDEIDPRLRWGMTVVVKFAENE